MLDGQLRGCIGSIVPQQPLVTDVAANACKAAFQDPRFKPLSASEAARLEVSVSILSHPRPLAAEGESAVVAALHPEEDGVILEAKGRDGQLRRGLFLPHVWEQLREPREFVRHLKAKAGLSPDGWPTEARLWRFRTETFQ
jgi:AmmeMemoRadiSam system protein A